MVTITRARGCSDKQEPSLGSLQQPAPQPDHARKERDISPDTMPSYSSFSTELLAGHVSNVQESFQTANASRWMANSRSSWWNAAIHPQIFPLRSNSEGILTENLLWSLLLEDPIQGAKKIKQNDTAF